MVNKETLVTNLFAVKGSGRQLIGQIASEQLVARVYRESPLSAGCRHSTANGSLGHHHTSGRSDIIKTQIEYQGALGGGTPRNALHIPRAPRT